MTKLACPAALVLALASTTAMAEATLDVGAYGALPDDAGNDAVAIQRALDAAGKAPTVVQFPAGVFRLERTLLPRDGMELRGAGPDRTVLLGMSDRNALVDVSGRSRVTLRGLTLTYETREYDRDGANAALVGGTGKGGEPAADIAVLDCVVRDTPKQGVIGQGSVRGNGPVRWRIANSVFRNTGRGALVLLSGDGIVVEDNRFERTGDDAIAFNLGTRNSVARRNTIRDAGLLLGQGAGIKIHGSNNLIEGNDIDGFVNAGIFLKKGNPKAAVAPADNVIQGNRIARPIDLPRKANQAGIQINDVAGRTTVRANDINAASATRNYDGIRIETSPEGLIEIIDNTITAERAGASGANAVRLLSSVRSLDVLDNRLRVLGPGVLLRTHGPGGRVAISGNQFLSAGESAVVAQHPKSAGLGALVVRGNRLAQSHRGPLLDLANLRVDELDVSDNTGAANLRPSQGLRGVRRLLGRD